MSKFYEAPIQLKANGGVFLVDDFGRQRMRPAGPAEPLDRAARKPHRLPDAAHRQEVPGAVRRADRLRDEPRSRSRWPTKRSCAVFPTRFAIDDPTLDEFTRIFELNCQRRNLRFHQVMVAYLQRRHYEPVGPAAARVPSARPARSGDRALPLSRRSSRSITRELLDAACKSYFVDERAHAAAARDAEDVGQADGRALMDLSRRHRRHRSARTGHASVRCSSLLSINLLADFLRTGGVTGLLLLVSEVAGRRADDRPPAGARSSIDRSAPVW